MHAGKATKDSNVTMRDLTPFPGNQSPGSFRLGIVRHPHFRPNFGRRQFAGASAQKLVPDMTLNALRLQQIPDMGNHEHRWCGENQFHELASATVV